MTMVGVPYMAHYFEETFIYTELWVTRFNFQLNRIMILLWDFFPQVFPFFSELATYIYVVLAWLKVNSLVMMELWLPV
jgi:hypothetical protein